MFSLKKKKTRGVRAAGYQDPVTEILSDSEEPFEWLEQHHKKTLNKSQLHVNNNSHTIATIINGHNTHNTYNNNINQIIDYPMSGDESDNYNNQMESLRSQFYTSDPQKRTKEYHIEQGVQAIELLKVASGPNGWKKVDKHKSGCTVFQSTGPTTIPTSQVESRYPAFKGEHIIRGYKAQDVFAIISVRKLWDDWYDELSCVETYDEATMLMYMVMKSTLSAKMRDLAFVERTVTEKDGTIYSAACSVESTKVPTVSGKVRAAIFLAGWIIQPLPSNPPITKITYVIHTDLLSRLPKFIARRSLAKRAMAIVTIETYLRKNSTPTLTASSAQSHNRKRSLSEPAKPELFLLPPESDDDEPSESSFLAPLGPFKSRHDLHIMDDSAVESADDEPNSRRERKQSSKPQSSVKTKAPATGNTFATEKVLFNQEFMESNSFLQNSSLFGESLSLFDKDTAFDGSQKKKDESSVASAVNSRVQPSVLKQQIQERPRERAPEKSLERARAHSNASRTFIHEPDTRKSTNNKRISIPVVAPKSEARMKSFSGNGSNNDSSNQLSVPDSTASTGMISPTTPPLTPPASINDKDGTSDSDAAQTPEVKVVPRMPKILQKPVELSPSLQSSSSSPSSPSSPASGSLAMSSFAMKSPSAMMEARRHSALIGRSTGFVPRHSHAVPIRGNPNVSLQSLTRPSGPNGTMTTTMKRHSTAPSLDSSRSSLNFFTPVMVLPHRHSETARKALAMFKVLASSPEDRWRAISSENGFKSYSRVISGAGLPMLRGEGTITGGWTVEQINAVIESSGCRQIWDERFENMSIAETFNHNEYLFHVTLRGVGSLTGRDLAGVTMIDRDPQTSALYNVSTSVLDPTIPEDPGRIRAMLELSGWSLRPTFDGQGNTVSVNVTFVVQIDIRGNLPSSVVKSMTASMTSAVSRLNQFINKSGYPPFASHISGTRLLDTFDPKVGLYELCYKAAPGWTEVRIGRKVYKEGYDFFIKPDDPSVRVEMAPDFGGVRVWTTLDHEGQSIIAQVSRKGQNLIKSEPMEEQKQEAEAAAAALTAAENSRSKNDSVRHSDIDPDMKQSIVGRTRRSASNATPSSTQGNAFSSSSSVRPDSQASVASKASQSSDRSRSRGRTPRSIVTLPAGTPPPPLPRRSSSLSRYSIPISPYLAPIDAPPLPANMSASIASATEMSPRPISIPESPLGSPTLGFFHIPHAPVVTPVLMASPTEMRPPHSAVPFAAPMESITTVLSGGNPTSPVKDAAPESSLSIVAIAIAPETETVSVTTTEKPEPAPATALVSPKEAKADEATSLLLSSQASPAATPVPSPMMPTFAPRDSSSSATTPPSPTASSPTTTSSVSTPASVSTTTFQPTSRLKNSTSSLSLGGVKRRENRVTFSLDTIDKSSSSSPLDTLAMMNQNSGRSTNANMVKEHNVQIVSAQHHQTVVVEEALSSSEYESDEAEFVEARDELSEDEMELALVLTSASSLLSASFPSSASNERASPVSIKNREQKPKEEEMVGASLKAAGHGLKTLTTGSPAQVKIAIVFLLLVYYASRLASFFA